MGATRRQNHAQPFPETHAGRCARVAALLLLLAALPHGASARSRPLTGPTTAYHGPPLPSFPAPTPHAVHAGPAVTGALAATAAHHGEGPRSVLHVDEPAMGENPAPPLLPAPAQAANASAARRLNLVAGPTS